MKDRKSIYIVCLIMLVTSISIGYAIVSGWLNINGTAKINAAKWDIYFKNVKIKDGSVTASVAPSISNKTTVNFEVELKKPGDFYEFNVDVVNDGDLDAMIESISITPELTLDQQKYLNYTVTYADGVVIEEKDILHAQKTRTLKVKAEYLKNISNNELVLTEETINVHVEIKYVQADNTAKESTSLENDIPKFASVITGNGTQVGDEIAIGDEHFYVISNDGDNITMFAKYNLLVGNTCSSSSISSCTLIQNQSGIQSETATGRVYINRSVIQYPIIGTVPFSSSNYWGKPGDKAYVYNDNASISQYVNNYKTYLEGLGVSITEARLISYDELLGLGCTMSNGCQKNGAPQWIRSTSYWTGSLNTNSNGQILYISSNDGFASYTYGTSDIFGVRPVIVIPASSI